MSVATVAPIVETWAVRNQRWLAERLVFWQERIEDLERPPSNVEPSPLDGDESFEPAAVRLRSLFGLSTFETELLILAAGVEIDDALRSIVAKAQGLSPQDAVSVSFSLALRVLPDAHWDAISPVGALRYWSLLEFDTGPGLAQSLVRIDERVLHYLTGVPAFDDRLDGIATIFTPAPSSSDSPLARRIARTLIDGRTPVVVLSDGMHDADRRRRGREEAAALFGLMGLRTLSVAASAIAGNGVGVISILRRLDREAALISAGIVLDADTHDHAAVAHIIASLRSPVVLLGALSGTQLGEIAGRQVVRFNMGSPVVAPPGGIGPTLERAARRALRQFGVEPELLNQALASMADVDEGSAGPALWEALREAARGGLDTLAQRIDSRATFDDLVLPMAPTEQLRQITRQLRHRDTVYGEWAFGELHTRGLGIAALFAGESGTGKTLAAEVIANEARLDLYRIDLSSVVSKYIGETEKNLATLFDAAERSGAVLLFDEADALFGKRSEVRDSHDRYANIEVAYLLQRIESYRGLAILTTNAKSALDRAFLRRIQFVVQFPFPDVAARVEIWKRVFPRQAPIRDLDVMRLGRLNLSGGGIRSVAINAAFLAAARDGVIDTAVVLEAARAEYAKLERRADAALEASS